MSNSGFHPNATPDFVTPKSAESEQEAFSLHANSAWGIAFITTETVNTAVDAVADGFVDLFQTLDNGTEVSNPHFEILRMTHSAAIRLVELGPAGRHAREPVSILGETNNRQATLALTALPEKLRTCLWLVDAEHLGIAEAATILQTSEDSVRELLTRARVNFQSYYVNALNVEDMKIGCEPTHALLSGYASGTLEAGNTSRVQAHVNTCDECHEIINKVKDLEARLHEAIPPMPGRTRQYVLDTWGAIHETEDAKPKPHAAHSHTFWFSAAVVSAAAVLIIVMAFAGIFSSDHKVNSNETQSTHLAAPASAPQRHNDSDDQFAVATPTFTPTDAAAPDTSPETTVTTTTPKREVTTTTTALNKQ